MGVLCHLCALGKSAVSVLCGLGSIDILSVGGFAEKQIGIGCSVYQRFTGSSISGKDDAKTGAIVSKNHMRGDGRTVRQCYTAAALQHPPLILGDLQMPSGIRIELAGTAQRKTVSLTGDPVAGRNRSERSIGAPLRKKRVQGEPFSGQKDRLHGKRKCAGQCEDRLQSILQPLRTGEKKRIRPPETPERLQKTGQAEQMVSVIMREGDQIRFHQAGVCLACAALGAFSAVEKDGSPAKSEMCTG